MDDGGDTTGTGASLFVLDLASAIWSKIPTRYAKVSDYPGVRALHVTTVSAAPVIFQEG